MKADSEVVQLEVHRESILVAATLTRVCITQLGTNSCVQVSVDPLFLLPHSRKGRGVGNRKLTQNINL